MKKLEELTEEEAREILDYAVAHHYKDDKYGAVLFRKVLFKPDPKEPNRITLAGRAPIGIHYSAGINQDGFVLHFDNTRCVDWLYKHGYDVGKLIEANSYLSDVEGDFEMFSDTIHDFVKDHSWFWADSKHKSLREARKTIEAALEKYYYKDYE